MNTCLLIATSVPPAIAIDSVATSIITTSRHREGGLCGAPRTNPPRRFMARRSPARPLPPSLSALRHLPHRTARRSVGWRHPYIPNPIPSAVTAILPFLLVARGSLAVDKPMLNVRLWIPRSPASAQLLQAIQMTIEEWILQHVHVCVDCVFWEASNNSLARATADPFWISSFPTTIRPRFLFRILKLHQCSRVFVVAVLLCPGVCFCLLLILHDCHDSNI